MGPIIISGIFAGNAVVIKTSEQTAWSSGQFISIVREAVSTCGHDPNLVQAFSCWPQTAGYFTSHPGLSHLTFMGSKPVAHEVAKSASKVPTPLCIEQKDAAVVLDQPDGRAVSKKEMNGIASILIIGVFHSSGQNRIGIERTIAMPAAYDILIEMLEPRIRHLRPGNDLDPENCQGTGVDVGALISPASFDRLESLIAEARGQGSRSLVGGHRFQVPTPAPSRRPLFHPDF